MMPLDSLATLPWLCYWTELIMSQHPQTCRLPLSAQAEQHSCWMQSTLSPLQPQPSPCEATDAALSLLWLHQRPQIPPDPTAATSLARKVLCLSTSTAVVKLEKAHSFFPGTHQHLYWHGGQAERVVAFPDHFKWSCSKVPTCYAMQLPANAAGVFASARFREASSHLHVCALLLSLQKCGIYRYRPSGRTQARWDIGQSQLSFLFDPIWSLLLKECSQKFYSYIKLCEFAGFLEHNIWVKRSREGKSKINYNEVWNAVRYFIHKGDGCAKLPFWARSFPDAAHAVLTWRESWDLYYFLIKLGRRI